MAEDGFVERVCFPGRREAIALRSPAARKPGAHVHVRPFDASVSPLAAAGETPVSHAPENKPRSPLACKASDAGAILELVSR
jgi:hypothetical protein